MKRNVVLAATARLAASLFALILLTVAPALAGDRALLNVLGYSEDGTYIAFEEFGVLDGSGGYYSHSFVVDLEKDSWVKGSPYSIETPGDDGDDARTLPEVRAAVMKLAAPTLTSLKIDVPAETLNLIADGIPDMDGKTMVVDTPSCCGSNDVDTSIELKLTLKTFPAKMADQCQVDTALGFSLDVDYWDGTSAQVHKDGDTLPKSRSCPQDYRLYSVVTPLESGMNRVAFVSSYPFDFEGVSRRFLVVPLEAGPARAGATKTK